MTCYISLERKSIGQYYFLNKNRILGEVFQFKHKILVLTLALTQMNLTTRFLTMIWIFVFNHVNFINNLENYKKIVFLDFLKN